MVAGSRASGFGLCQELSNRGWYSNKVNQLAWLWAGRTTTACVLLSLHLLTSVGLTAQLPDRGSRALIHGSIVTAQGQPVASATVEVRDHRGIKVGTCLTNSAGSFAIATLAEPGEYFLLAAKELQMRDERIVLDQRDIEVKIALPTISGNAAGMSPQRFTVSARELSVAPKARTHLKLAHEDFSRSNFAGAGREVDRALQVDPHCAAAFSMRAFLRLASKNLDGALEDAKHAVLLDPNDADALLALATTYNSLMEFKKAEEAAQQVLRIRPDSWQGQLEMAKAWQGEGRFVLALLQLDALNKDFPDVHLVRGNVLMRLDRGQEAVDEFSLFLREAPHDPRRNQIGGIVAKLQQANGPNTSDR